MLIPYTHEDMRSRRWPVLTTALVAINIICHLLFWSAVRSYERDVMRAEDAFVRAWDAHPELDVPPSLRELGSVSEQIRQQLQPSFSRPRSSPPSAEDAEELDRLATAFVERLKESPARRWGYVPKANNLLGLFTYAFVHGGWLHLLGNMWFLWLCACNLEDRWGRLVFVPMYLAAGVVAALVQRLVAPESPIPLVGASGAIAGAMGAFLVVYARTKIRFAYAFFMGRFTFGTFSAPAWLMLPLWLLEQIFWAVVSRRGEAGVAYFAHIGGFAFGVMVGTIMIVSGLDRKLDDAVDAKVTTSQDARILAASDMIDRGDARGALAALDRFIAENPGSIDAYLEVLRAAKAAADGQRQTIAYGRLVDLYVREGHLDTARDLYEEADELGYGQALPPATRMRLAERLVQAGQGDRALPIYANLVAKGVSDAPTARAALAYSKLLVASGRGHQVHDLLQSTAQSPGLPADLRETAKLLLAETSPRSLPDFRDVRMR